MVFRCTQTGNVNTVKDIMEFNFQPVWQMLNCCANTQTAASVKILNHFRIDTACNMHEKRQNTKFSYIFHMI